MRKTVIALVLVNSIGAFFTFFYFSFVLFWEATPPGEPAYFNYVFFLGGCGVLFLSFLLLRGRATLPMREVARGSKSIDAWPREEQYLIKQAALRFPWSVSVTSFGVWLGAGFLFGFLRPLLSARLFDVPLPDLVLCLKQFCGIAFLGGGVTCLVLFFILEDCWREVLPRFFPQGELGAVRNGFRLSVRKRLMGVLLGIVLIPLPVAGVILVSNLERINRADALSRPDRIVDLYVELTYVSADFLFIALVLSVLLARSICRPLEEIHTTVKAVTANDLTARVQVRSNDELGDVGQGINGMVESLDRTSRDRDSFGRYLCREIREEISAGRVDFAGEMKRVTLLFSDLRNFTGLVEKNHPRDVLGILNQYFDEMTEAVKSHKGLILQYVGDEIEAVFGAPVGYEDHPEMAVKAALDMRARLAALNRRLADQGIPPLEHGIGIHSGAVLAGNIGSHERMTYTLVGDTVNAASRIEGLAKTHGTDIVMSKTTHDLLTGAYEMEQLGPVQVKGKAERLIIYKLKG